MCNPSWMRPSTLEKYYWWLGERRNQKAHQIAKHAFNLYLFQLSGCKFLLHKFIELPIIFFSRGGNVGDPARRMGTHLNDLLIAYDAHKETEEYQNAVERSRRRAAGRCRLSHDIRWMQYALAQGRKLSIQKNAGDIDIFDLDTDQQQLIEDFETRRSRDALDKLLAQKKLPYRGTGSETC